MTKSKRATPDEIKAARALLCAIFPNTFEPGKGEKKPLKLDIRAELRAACKTIAPGLSKRVLGAFLDDYTEGIRYLRNVRVGAARVDLDGNPCGVVTEREAAYAREQFLQRERYIARRYKSAVPPPPATTEGAE